MSDTVYLNDPALNQQIKFQTEPVEHIPKYVCANARCRTCDRIPWRHELAEEPDLPGCECDEPNQLPAFGAADQDARGDKRVAICGAGPSLNEAYREIRKADHVWACNRAANYLEDWDWPLTHALAIDAGIGMVEDCWPDPPDPRDGFILATTVNPLLTDHLLEHGRDVTFFHSLRGGLKLNEQWLYTVTWPPTPMTGSGLNVVNRAIDLAIFLGYRHIWVCGADNALGPDDQMYATGERVHEQEDVVVLTGTIDGRKWRTKPDMLMSAVYLARMKKAEGDLVEFVGNTLPGALARKSDAFLDRCISWG